MDEALRRYQLDLARAQMSRRRFMSIAALGGVSAALAACGGGTTASNAPSAVASTPASAAPPSAAPSAAPASAPASQAAAASYPPPESDLFMFNWSQYFADDNKALFEKTFNSKITYDTYPSNEELLA